jgi:hypothetical protein
LFVLDNENAFPVFIAEPFVPQNRASCIESLFDIYHVLAGLFVYLSIRIDFIFINDRLSCDMSPPDGLSSRLPF